MFVRCRSADAVGFTGAGSGLGAASLPEVARTTPNTSPTIPTINRLVCFKLHLCTHRYPPNLPVQ